MAIARAFNPGGRLLPKIGTAARGKLQKGNDAMAFVRPEALAIAAGRKGKDENRLTASIKTEEFEGQSYNIFLNQADGAEIKMSLVNQGQAYEHAPGSQMTLSCNADQAVVLPAGALASE